MRNWTFIIFVVFCLTPFKGGHADFFDNLSSLRESREGEGHGSLYSYLTEIELACIPVLHAEHDRNYYVSIGMGFFRGDGISQSPASLQSRMCATLVDQYDPHINRMNTDLGGCEKFGPQVKPCCDLLASADRGVVKGLCKGVPSHFALMDHIKSLRTDGKERAKATCATEVKSDPGSALWRTFSYFVDFFQNLSINI